MNSGGTNSLLNKKGFTLIELLSVIVILAIIILIATPIILNIINTVRYGAFGVSKKNIERVAELYYLSNNNKVLFDGNIAYIELGELKERGYISKGIAKIIDKEEISDGVKILLYKRGKNIEYHLQMYDESFLKWYQLEMIKGAKKEGSLPNNIGDKIQIGLIDLMTEKRVSELRIPSNLKIRCEGYVEVEKTSTNKYEYNAYVDCLEKASSFASNYVSYGGKYIDEFNDVKETNDGGFIAVGRSNSEIITKYGTGNNGKYDAIIVKFDNKGNVEWSRNFGGSNNDYFNAVVEGLDGYVAVGSTSSEDYDIGDYKGGVSDALIVKYNKQGEVVYKKNYGGSGDVGSEETFNDIIFVDNKFIIVGYVNATLNGDLFDFTGTLGSQGEGIIISVDLDFNIMWRSLFCGNYFDYFYSLIKTTENDYLVVGSSFSDSHDMRNLGTNPRSYGGIIIKYDSEGSLLKKKSFQGAKNDYFYDVIEVNDGYIMVGNSNSSDQYMEDLSKADNNYKDAIIIKYDKNLDSILWKKSFGGSDDDVFNSIVKVNNNEIITVGYSKSTDMNMLNLNNLDGYSKSIIVKYNTNNGNIIESELFGGSSSDVFNKIIKTSDNKYLVVGNTYSNNGDLMKFNKGHSDAIVVKYDINLNLEKSLIEPVVLIDVLKKIEPNYGTNISFKYNAIYTSNDPTKDLLGWCTGSQPYLEGNTSNYYYGVCLQSFNTDDKKLLFDNNLNVNLVKNIIEGNNEFIIEKDYNVEHWIQILFSFASGTTGIAMSNLKLKFNDGYIGHITDAIDKGYIEPLVTVSNRVSISPRSFENIMDIINDKGNTGLGNYPQMIINIKIKNSKLTTIKFDSNKTAHSIDGLGIYELRNFDMSITPTN